VAVIDWLRKFEAGMCSPHRRLAPHRDAGANRPDRQFPPHAILKVDSYELGVQLKEDLQAFFAARPDEYPLEDGWDVDFVYGPRPRRDGTAPSSGGNPLTPDHPWKMYHRHGAKRLGKQMFQRLLIVHHLGREGQNNWACCTAGLCCPVGSDVT